MAKWTNTKQIINWPNAQHVWANAQMDQMCATAAQINQRQGNENKPFLFYTP